MQVYSLSLLYNLPDLVKSVSQEKIIFRTGYVKVLNCIKQYGELEKEGFWSGNKYYQLGWIANFDIFLKGYIDFYKEQNQELIEWNNLADIEKLFHLLKHTFDMNQKAHRQGSRSRRGRFFCKKSRELEYALMLSNKCTSLSFFHYGKQYDDSCIGYPVSLYFEFGKEQVSFHCDIEEAPDFEGKWVGYKQLTYPFHLRNLRRLIIQAGKIDRDLSHTNLEGHKWSIESIQKYLLDQIPKPPEIQAEPIKKEDKLLESPIIANISKKASRSLLDYIK